MWRTFGPGGPAVGNAQRTVGFAGLIDQKPVRRREAVGDKISDLDLSPCPKKAAGAWRCAYHYRTGVAWGHTILYSRNSTLIGSAITKPKGCNEQSHFGHYLSETGTIERRSTPGVTC